MSSFKELIVWQKGIDLVETVYGVSTKLPSHEKFGLSSQITRAAVSIPSNVAEGYRRSNRKEYAHFCAIALGSAAELETQLIIINRVYPEIDIDLAVGLNVEVQKMLTILISKLKIT